MSINRIAVTVRALSKGPSMMETVIFFFSLTTASSMPDHPATFGQVIDDQIQLCGLDAAFQPPAIDTAFLQGERVGKHPNALARQLGPPLRSGALARSKHAVRHEK